MNRLITALVRCPAHVPPIMSSSERTYWAGLRCQYPFWHNFTGLAHFVQVKGKGALGW